LPLTAQTAQTIFIRPATRAGAAPFFGFGSLGAGFSFALASASSRILSIRSRLDILLGMGRNTEALAIAERLGLDARRTLQVFEQSSAQSWIASDRLPRALAGDFEPRAHTSLLAKDTTLALAMAADAGLQPQLAAAAQQLFARACASGLASLDDASLLTLMRRLLGNDRA